MAMQPIARLICASVVCSLVGIGGCYSESSDELTFDESDLLLDEEMSSEVGKVQESGRPSSGSPLGEDRSESGSKHALVKRVTQTLSQLTPDGIETSQAQMAAWFDVSVETMSDGELSYGVVYRRVTYSEKLPGGSQSYDSNDDTAAVPAAFANLSELTRSGFTFRTRGDRTGLELVIVPSTLFSGDRKGTAAAEFIYDRIGLVLLGRSAESLPTAPVMRTRRIVSPIPMEFSTRFAVKASGSGTITLDVFGSVATSQPTTDIKLVGGTAAVSLKGGYAFGDMTVDEHNCVPRRADWNRYVDISLVKTRSGDRIAQQQHEVVTIRGIEANDPKNVPDQPTVAPAAVVPSGPTPVAP